MSFIEKQQKIRKGTLTVKLPEDVLADLENYASYLDSDKSYVIEKLVCKAVEKDKEYQEAIAGKATKDVKSRTQNA